MFAIYIVTADDALLYRTDLSDDELGPAIDDALRLSDRIEIVHYQPRP